MVTVPLRTQKLWNDAVKLQKEGFYAQALLLYSHYLEQVLLISYLSYVEEKDPSKTKLVLDKIIRIKDERNLTFGNILSFVNPIIKNVEMQRLCKEVKEVRDTLAAHFFFVVNIDPLNKTKRAFYDVNNYKKLIRRLYKFVRKTNRMSNVEYFLKHAAPWKEYKTIEKDALAIEDVLLEIICERIKLNVTNVAKKLPYQHTIEMYAESL